jgi:Tfp pilus assembly protein PilO
LAQKINIPKLDKKKCLMIGVVGSLALSAVFYQFCFDSSKKKLSDIHRQIEDHNKRISTAIKHSSMIKKMEEEVTAIEKQLGTIRTKIATSGEIIPIIKTIEREALRLDLKVLKMSTRVVEPPPPPAPDSMGDANVEADTILPGQVPGYIKVSFDINLQGRYDKLEKFINVLQDLATFLIIDTLEINSDEKLYPRAVSNIMVNVYSKKEVSDIVAVK